MTGAGSLRLSAGRLKGRKVLVPAGVRPTEGRVREALFDILGPDLVGARFLDLFAGSGAVGLEAASRGAGEVWQADIDPAAVRALERCYDAMGVERARALRLELPREIGRLPARRFDSVFADPPYDFDRYADLLAALPRVMASEGLAIVEHARREGLPAAVGSLARTAQRVYGETALDFFRLIPA